MAPLSCSSLLYCIFTHSHTITLTSGTLLCATARISQVHVATSASSGGKPAGLRRGSKGSCQGCSGDRRRSRRGRRGGNTHNFPRQPQLLLPPCVSSETTAAEPPSAWGAALPLIVGSKETALLLFFGLSWGPLTWEQSPSPVCCALRAG